MKPGLGYLIVHLADHCRRCRQLAPLLLDAALPVAQMAMVELMACQGTMVERARFAAHIVTALELAKEDECEPVVRG